MNSTPTDDDLDYVQAGMGADLDIMLVFNLLRTHAHLGTLIDAQFRGRELTAAQFNALLVLRAAQPAGLPMGEIGQRLVVTKSNVTGLVDRLEQQGLVRRVEQEDRRVTVVRLTEAGRGLLDRITPDHATLLARLTGCLAPREKQTLISLLTKLRRELRRQREEAR